MGVGTAVGSLPLFGNLGLKFLYPTSCYREKKLRMKEKQTFERILLWFIVQYEYLQNSMGAKSSGTTRGWLSALDYVDAVLLREYCPRSKIKKTIFNLNIFTE